MRKLEAEFDVLAVYNYFPLHPDTPPEGRTLAELFGGRESYLEESKRRLTEAMRLEGLPYGERTHTYNSRNAQELAVWGDELRVTDALHDALFKAYFVEARNIAEVEVLMEVAASCGLDPQEARAVLEERRYAAEVDRQWMDCGQIGVTGVPTFAAGGFGVVGAQPYEVLVSLMERVGVARRNGE